VNGLCRASGAPATITLGCEVLRLPPLTLEDLGTIEHHLIQVRRWEVLRTVHALRGALPADVWQSEWAAARERADKIRSLEEREVLAWLDSDAGFAFSLWLMLDKRYPGRFTPDGLFNLVSTLPPDELLRLRIARDQAAALDHAAWSDWPRKPRTDDGGKPPPPKKPLSWKQVFWRLVQPPEIGGHGLSPDAVKRLTLFELRLYGSDEHAAGGIQRMSLADAQALGYLPPPGPRKTYADPVARERELYEKHFGKPMPEHLVNRMTEWHATRRKG
jgi:hypothetical protein